MIISRTPLRMSFTGGGSDLKEFYRYGHGAVVSTAINKYAYVFVNKRFDDSIRLGYSSSELVEKVDDIKHDLIREALKITRVSKAVDIVYIGDVQLGKAGLGLASSSSIAVGVLNALYAYKGKYAQAEKLAKEACKIEIDRLGHPIGKQDQYIVSYGGFNYIQFNKNGSVNVEPIRILNSTKRKLKENILALYTGIIKSSKEVLTEQRKNFIEQKEKIDIVSKMVLLAKEMRETLNKNKIDYFGEMLHENWLLKKKLAKGISTSVIDEWYDIARRNGAIGGKICGAGGGGFLLLYAPKNRHNKIISVLSELKPIKFSFEPQGSKIIYVGD